MKGFGFDFDKFSRELIQEISRQVNESIAKEARVLDRAPKKVSNDDVIGVLNCEIENMERTLERHYAERGRFYKYTDFDAVIDHEMQKNYYEGRLEALMDFKGLLSSNFNLEKGQEK